MSRTPLALVLAASVAALAAVPGVAAAVESPRYGSFEFRVVPWRPAIDNEFASGPEAPPYNRAFGGGRKLMVRADAAWSVWKDFGTLDLGLGVGYVQARGHGRLPDGGSSGDATALRIVPTSLTLTYRLDTLSNLTRWFPFAPYGRVSLERYNWWVTNGGGGVAGALGRRGAGATNGYSYGGGLAFLLDVLSPRLALDLDNDTGINHSYLYVDVSKTKVDDFGSSKSWDLSPDHGVLYGFGMLFVF